MPVSTSVQHEGIESRTIDSQQKCADEQLKMQADQERMRRHKMLIDEEYKEGAAELTVSRRRLDEYLLTDIGTPLSLIEELICKLQMAESCAS